MNAGAATGLTVADLERRLAQADAAVLLVPPRILRRVIKKDCGLGGPGLQVPHRKSYVVDRAALLRIADRDELGVAADRDLPATVILLPLPEPSRLDARSCEETLLKYWRLLFHARVHIALARRRADGTLDAAAVRARIARLGPTEFDEARSVTRQDHFLLPPGDPATVYEEFAALYLELRYFTPDRLAGHFPDVADFAAIDRLLAEDVNAAELFATTRLEGAPDPCPAGPSVPDADCAAPQPVVAVHALASTAGLAAKADREAARGNQVQAAILRQRAAQFAAAHAEIERLLSRLRQAVALPDDEIDAWREALVAALAPAATGLWPIEARLLYDLQNVCVDRERAIYAVDLVEWVVSWGHRPIKRPLPNQPLVLTVKHLHKALHRLPAVRIAEPLRLRLVRLLQSAVDRSEQQLRARFRPMIEQALDRVGLRPANYAERVSRDKLIEELLDRVVERRFLGMGDLRDAIARNQLKLPDLAGPREFLLGDQLICANRQFADDLDGVYRRGEIYLRWLQRLSAAAFGTRVGRWLTLFLFLPFGGAYLALEAVHHVAELFQPHAPNPTLKAATALGLLATPGPEALLWAPALLAKTHHGLHLVNRYSVVALGLFLLALMHVGWFREAVGWALIHACHGARRLFYEWPAALLRVPWVRAFLQSRPYLLFYQFVLKPLVWALGVVGGCSWFGLPPANALAAGAGVFLLASVMYNSRLGLYLEEIGTDAAWRTWELFRRDVVPGLFRLVLFVFKRLLEDVERVLYAVDELLRFRTGDSRFGLVWKPALGLVWFCVTYLIRVGINLFVEPTVNPIKHFPVVTVTAKLIVPLYGTLTQVIVVPLEPVVGVPLAYALSTAAIFFLPGLAGFLVWELKENWRLYRSNRRPVLEPVVVGSHGETVVRFLRPGLHSGTLPKLYARLRRARGAAANKQHELLHHAGESLRHFIERDFLAVLAASKRWNGVLLQAGSIRLGTNRIRCELQCPSLAGASVCLDFDERSGWLAAGLFLPPGGHAASWLAHLQPAQAAALRDALAGLYKIAGVALLREPADAVLPAAWPLDANVLPPDRLRFDVVPLTWTDWVQTWELDQAGKEPGGDRSECMIAESLGIMETSSPSAR